MNFENKKFNLNYKIVVEDINGILHIISSINEKGEDILESLSVNINVEKTITDSSNKCKLEVINLKESTRKVLKKSRLDSNIYRSLEIYAGYNNKPALIFKGNIETANSYRQNTEFITEIVGMDGQFGIINSQTNKSFDRKFGDNLNIVLASDLKNINVGYITETNPFKIGERGRVLEGNTWNLISGQNLLQTFINDEKVFILQPEEVIANDILIIDNESGLLNTPKEYDGYLEVEMLFEPNVVLGGLTTLESKTAKEYNGNYKLIGANHQLSVSKIGKGSEGKSMLKLQYAFKEFKQVRSK